MTYEVNEVADTPRLWMLELRVEDELALTTSEIGLPPRTRWAVSDWENLRQVVNVEYNVSVLYTAATWEEARDAFSGIAEVLEVTPVTEEEIANG